MKKVIAIDGVAGAGKGTLSKALAKKIGFLHLDTGALYRTATVLILQSGIDPQDEKAVSKAVSKAKIEVKLIDGVANFFLNGKNLSTSNALRTPEVNENVATISPYPALRNQIRKIQHKIAKKQNIVIEGRDITTVVFPNAWLKFYIDAPVDVRAERRHKEFLAQNKDISIEEVKQMILDRDRLDIERENCPLICPSDAIVINNTKTIEDAVNEMYQAVIKKQQN